MWILRRGVVESAKDGEYVALAHDEILLSVKLHLGAGIFPVKHRVTGFEYHFFVFCSFTYSKNGALKRLLFGCVGNDDAACSLFFGGSGLDEHAVSKRLNVHFLYFFVWSFKIGLCS